MRSSHKSLFVEKCRDNWLTKVNLMSNSGSKQKLIISWLLLIYGFLLSADAQEWLSATTFQAEGNYTGVGRSMAVDNDGRLYVIGGACSITAGGERFPATDWFPNKHGYIFQYERGEITKLINFGDFCFGAVGAVNVTDHNDICVTGWYCDSLLFGDTELFRKEGSHMFLCKLDSTGNTAWAVDGAGGGSTYIDTDKMNNIYIGGLFRDSLTLGPNTFYSKDAEETLFPRDAYVAKYSSEGEFHWCASAGGPGFDLITNLEYGREAVFVTIFHSDTLILGAGTVIPVTGESSTLWAIDENGNTIWHKTRSGDAYSSGGIRYDSDRELLYLAGQDYYDQDSSGKGLYLESHSPDGSVIWRRDLAHSYSFDVEIDTAGSIYIAGSYREDVVWDGISAGLVTEYTRFLAKLDRNGTCLWIRPMTTTQGSYPVDLVVVGEDDAYLLVEAFPSDGETVFTAANGTYAVEYGSYYIAHLAHPSAEAVRPVHSLPRLTKRHVYKQYNMQGRVMGNERMAGQICARKAVSASFIILENGKKQVRLR